MQRVRSIQFYPTLRCNQGCTFCFNMGMAKDAFYRDMHSREADTLAGLLADNGVREIDVLGGEPMLVPWMEDFARRVTRAGVTMNISTNGSLPDAANRLSKVSDDLINIGVSLHGLPETHNALTGSDNFSRAVTGIRRMVQEERNPIVKSALTRRNMGEIHGLVEYLRDMGVRRYFILHEDIIGRDEQTLCLSFPRFLAFFLRLKEDFGDMPEIGFVAASGFYKYGMDSPRRCDAGTEKIAIMPDGSAFPCNLCAGLPEFRLGNIFRDGLDEICSNPVLDYFNRDRGARGCEARWCTHRDSCSGGCPAHIRAFRIGGGGTDPRCIFDSDA